MFGYMLTTWYCIARWGGLPGEMMGTRQYCPPAQLGRPHSVPLCYRSRSPVGPSGYRCPLSAQSAAGAAAAAEMVKAESVITALEHLLQRYTLPLQWLQSQPQ